MDYAAEAARDAREYRAAVDALTRDQREAWNIVLAANEYFDGEDAIAHGTLDAMRRRGELTLTKVREKYAYILQYL